MSELNTQRKKEKHLSGPGNTTFDTPNRKRYLVSWHVGWSLWRKMSKSPVLGIPQCKGLPHEYGDQKASVWHGKLCAVGAQRIQQCLYKVEHAWQKLTSWLSPAQWFSCIASWQTGSPGRHLLSISIPEWSPQQQRSHWIPVGQWVLGLPLPLDGSSTGAALLLSRNELFCSPAATHVLSYKSSEVFEQKALVPAHLREWWYKKGKASAFSYMQNPA